MKFFLGSGRGALIFAAALSAAAGGAATAVFGACGPFTDVTDAAFCPFITEIFALGITTGTTATTYDPASTVSRLQMAAFLSRTVDGTLKRGGRRAALDQYWTPKKETSLGLTAVGATPELVKADGDDVWVASFGAGTVSQVHAGNGKLVGTWTGAANAFAVLVAAGKVLVTGDINPGALYGIDPAEAPGAVAVVAPALGGFPVGAAFDGSRVFTANGAGSVSLVTPGATIPWTTTTVAAGFITPRGILFDGANIWLTDAADGPGTLLKLDSDGAILQTVTVGFNPWAPVFDGSSIWVPNPGSASVTVVRASSGAVLATLTGNGLTNPTAAAFDGQRVLVTNNVAAGTVSLWKAADLTPIGSFPTGGGTSPFGSCSDGANFWITLKGSAQLARF